VADHWENLVVAWLPLHLHGDVKGQSLEAGRLAGAAMRRQL